MSESNSNTKDVLAAIEKLAAKLGVKAEELMAYYIKEAKLGKLYYWLRIVKGLFVSVIGFIPTILLKDFVDFQAVNVAAIFFTLSCIWALIGFIMLIEAICKIVHEDVSVKEALVILNS